jgi:hypothetical protein
VWQAIELSQVGGYAGMQASDHVLAIGSSYLVGGTSVEAFT